MSLPRTSAHPAEDFKAARRERNRRGTPRVGPLYADRVIHPVTLAVRTALAAHADPERAASQQRYMKSAMPYYGVGSAGQRAALKPVWGSLEIAGADAWRAAVADLWDTATHREERYAAIDLLRRPRYAAWARIPDPATIALLRHLITTGAWWDYVDALASHCVGDLLRAEPEAITPILRAWAHEDDLWLRRTAIICQLFSRQAPDLDLLTESIEASLHDPDFFARKAIGWALRQHARTDPAWVLHFVAGHPELSGLSRREALKHLDADPAASRAARAAS